MKAKQSLNILKIAFLLIAIGILSHFIVSRLATNSTDKGRYIRPDPSIAVLPLINMSNDSSKEYFSDGLTEGILNSLAQIQGLKVCARTSSFKFRGRNLDLKEVGKKLGVHTVLMGSIQLQGDRVKLIMQLINVEDGFSLWSQQYNERIVDVFGLQGKIAASIAEKLEITLSKTRHSIPAKVITNKEAYELYLKGRACWNGRTPPELLKGIDFFHQAIKLDASFAAAYSGVADCYTALGYGSFLAPAEAFPKALEAATKSLELDSTLAEAHASLAFYKFYYDWDWAAAEEEFRIAIALNSNYEIGFDWYGYYLTAMKRYDEARTILKKAQELDPLSIPISTDIGFSLYYSGEYDTAINQLQHTLQINPKFPLANLWLGRSYQAKKLYPEAIQAYKQALAVSVNWPVALAALGHVYGVSGEKGEAKKILDTLQAISTRKFVTSYGMALIYAGIDDNEMAFKWLSKAFEERSHWLVWLKTDPRWASLQSDKRYNEFVNRVGLPD